MRNKPSPSLARGVALSQAGPARAARLAIGLVLAWVCLSAGQARAESLPPIPPGDVAVQSRCSAVSISPEVLNIGDTLTGTAQPATDQCGGLPDTVHWSWDFKFTNAFSGEVFSLPGLKGLPGCTMYRCQAKAVAPTDGWSDAGISGSSPFGEWTSFEPYIVIGHQHEVSGTVTLQGSDGQGVGGVRVRADCRGDGATTTTDANGKYNFLLGFGSCKISPEVSAGATSLPTERSVNVTTHSIDNVNFQVSCGAGGQARDLATAAATRGASPCELDVKVQVLEPVRSGLAVHSQPYQFYPVDFRAPKNSSTFVCESGCADVLVTVTDKKTHQIVKGARVKASLGAIAHVVSGGQLLCGPSGPCGTAISDQTTDENGQLRLIYWAPGVIEQTSVKLRVTAVLTCSQAECPVREKQGTGKASLTVNHYLIYEHAGELTEHEADLLAEWTHGTSLFTKFLKATPWGEKLVEFSAGVLEGAEIESEAVTKALALVEEAEPVLGPVVAAAELYNTYTELSERREMIAMFLDGNELSPVGLGRDPYEASAPPGSSLAFEFQLANAGTIAPLSVGAGGLLWQLGQTLAGLKKHHDPAFGSQSTELKVYEISYCDIDKGSCGPGFGKESGSTIGSSTPGIQPELYFEFSSQHNEFAHSFLTSFEIPYDPVVWAEVQPHRGGLRGVIK